jgi:SecD/SecF fusion protein
MDPVITFLCGAGILLMLLYYVGTAVHDRKRIIGTALIIFTTAFFLIVVQKEGIKRGIDLLGGSEFVVELKPGKDDQGNPKPVNPDDVQQAIGIFEKRLNPDGQKDLLVAPQGENRVLIQMPGVKESEFNEVRQKIQQVAKLEFRIAHDNSAGILANENSPSFLTDTLGYQKMPMRQSKDAKPDEVQEKSILVTNRPDLDGRYVKNAFANYDAEGWKVYLNFDSEGASLFDKVAEQNFQKRMAIVIDGEVISAPVLQARQFGGTAVISGNFTETEVRTLASVLENPLGNSVEIQSESTVSASYGESSIKQGLLVGYVALGLTTLFMLFVYRLAGIIAIIGLLVNLAILFGAMSLFQFTLTMPGIAGLVLTIGMAVDANVLIYERLREETAAGKSLSAALDAAYEKAFSAIADSNITTLISAVILYTISGGLVKGFSVTLMIGLLSSMIGALIVTRVIFMWAVDKGILKTIHTTRIIPDKVWDILSVAPKFIIASLVITAISFGVMFARGKNAFGIDFRGGSLVHAEIRGGATIPVTDVEKFLATLKSADGKPLGTTYVQEKSSTTGTMIAVRAEADAGPAIEQGLKNQYKDTITSTRLERVGSVIGSEMAKTSLYALGVALIAIFLYLCLRYEFAFALGAIVALFHDVLMVPGLCVLLGQEMSVIHVGALLTIAGYSINDTIVVFDRIRETIQKGGGGRIRDLMNEAICKTLSRTLLTGPTALAPMIVLLFMGNPSMKEFALPITIGVLLGTYSSIFIAAPLVLWYAKKTGTSLKRQVLDTMEQNTLRPGQVPQT